LSHRSTINRTSAAASANRKRLVGPGFAALDVRTNRPAWRQQWGDYCYGGSVVTRGGLVFFGHGDGRLTALDERTGEKLWDFMMDARVTAFEHERQQYVVVHAGGGVFANGSAATGFGCFRSTAISGPSLRLGSAATGHFREQCPRRVYPTSRTARAFTAKHACCAMASAARAEKAAARL
jgi:hypothetical protein